MTGTFPSQCWRTKTASGEAGRHSVLRTTGDATTSSPGVSRWRGPRYLAERPGKVALIRKPEVERHFRQRCSAACQLPLSLADALVQHVLVRRKSDKVLEKHRKMVGAQPGQARQFRNLDV